MDLYNIRRKGRFIELIKDDGLVSYYTINEAECWSIHTRKSEDEFSVEIMDRVGQVVMRWQLDDQTSAEHCSKQILKTVNRPRYLAVKLLIGTIILYFVLVGLVDFIHLLSSDTNTVATIDTPRNDFPQTNHEAEQLAGAIANADTREELQALIDQATATGLFEADQAAIDKALIPTTQGITPGYPESCL